MTEPQYVFLIGAARSGTKFLRDTLSVSDDVAQVPYDINYVWRHGNENCPHDELQPDDISEKAAAHIRLSIKRLALKDTKRSPKIILEKTVSNTLRVEAVRRVFPDAQFVYLERNGADAVESSYRQWTMPADRQYLIEKLRYFPLREWRYGLWFAKNLAARSEGPPIWGPRYKGISRDTATLSVPEVCATQWLRSVLLARESCRGPGTHTIRYEQLSDPEAGLAQLTGLLGLSDAERVLGHFNKTFNKTTTWPGAIPPGDRRAVEKIIELA